MEMSNRQRLIDELRTELRSHGYLADDEDIVETGNESHMFQDTTYSLSGVPVVLRKHATVEFTFEIVRKL